MNEKIPQPGKRISLKHKLAAIAAVGFAALMGSELLKKPETPEAAAPEPTKEKKPDPHAQAASDILAATPVTLRGTHTEHSTEYKAAQIKGAAYDTSAEIKRDIANGTLVQFTDSEHYYISGVGEVVKDPAIKNLYMTLRPEAKKFLDTFAAAFYQRFATKFKVTSLTRTEAYLVLLREKNVNASSTSSHLFGTTFDISHKIMTEPQKAWVRDYLLKFERAGNIDATEEHVQPCFHVFVAKF